LAPPPPPPPPRAPPPKFSRDVFSARAVTDHRPSVPVDLRPCHRVPRRPVLLRVGRHERERVLRSHQHDDAPVLQARPRDHRGHHWRIAYRHADGGVVIIVVAIFFISNIIAVRERNPRGWTMRSRNRNRSRSRSRRRVNRCGYNVVTYRYERQHGRREHSTQHRRQGRCWNRSRCWCLGYYFRCCRILLPWKEESCG
jgi:hypothetical protein